MGDTRGRRIFFGADKTVVGADVPREIVEKARGLYVQGKRRSGGS